MTTSLVAVLLSCLNYCTMVWDLIMLSSLGNVNWLDTCYIGSYVLFAATNLGHFMLLWIHDEPGVGIPLYLLQNCVNLIKDGNCIFSMRTYNLIWKSHSLACFFVKSPHYSFCSPICTITFVTFSKKAPWLWVMTYDSWSHLESLEAPAKQALKDGNVKTKTE
jgi:hypothetical protein